MASSNGQKSQGQALRHSHKELNTVGMSSSKVAAEQRRPFDPARISHWAAHSAVGPSCFPGSGIPDKGSLGYDCDRLPAGVTSQFFGDFPISPVDGFHTPLRDAPLDLQAGRGISLDNMSAAGAGNPYPGAHIDHDLSQDQAFGYSSAFGQEIFSNGLPANLNNQVYSNFDVGDFPSVDSHPPMVSEDIYNNNINNSGLTLASTWNAPRTDVTHPLDWSPVSDFTPSSSSMQSSNSLQGHQSDTPVSASTYDGVYMASQNPQIDGNSGMISAFDLGEPMAVPASMSYLDSESTIRPHQNFQRTPLPTMDMWSRYDVVSPVHTVSNPYNGYEGSRRSSEGEPKVPRDHPYYKATPKDGFYHCPFAATENCTHKPEKLKCNYDKHLDSHLKPYRCKSYECSQTQFSSTACLLRHEREAHGMHGHGPKPHLCYFKECERAQEDNGFPRRWNLFDHMKRVHDFAGTEPSNKSNSPAPSSSSPEPHVEVLKKKRTPSPIAQGSNKKAKVNATGRSIEATTGTQNTVKAKATTVEPEYLSQSLDQLLYEQLAQVQTRLQSLNPMDPWQWQQYQEDIETLQTIRMTIQFQQAQLAH